METPIQTGNSSRSKQVVIAGATGHLGSSIARSILKQGASVTALVRKGSTNPNITGLRSLGVNILDVDFESSTQLANACQGASCVVSAMSGLRDVIVGLQTTLLNAAIAAGVPHFIPSDFSADFTTLTYGNNRNLDFRKDFQSVADKAPIKVTSILNGMFMDLLTGQAPVILFKPKKILYWGNKTQPLDFTTIANTAEYAAHAALDADAPRWLRIAGDVKTIEQLKIAATEATGNKFSTLRPGGLGLLRIMMKITRALSPGKEEVFPPWQGMQYLHDMLSGGAKLSHLDNNRYPGVQWTSVKELLVSNQS